MLLTHHDGAQAPVNLQEYPDLFKLVFIPSNKYYESHLFNIDETQIKTLVPPHVKYIGHVTYSYQKKIPPFDFESLLQHHPQADLVALMHSPNFDLYAHAERWHPGFMRIWERLLALLGYGDFRAFPIPTAFFCNYWIMNKDKFFKYKAIAQKAMELIEADEQLRTWCDMDSSYQGTHMKLDTEKLMQIGGKPYYTFHPFVMERLICFVAQAEKWNVALLTPQDAGRYPLNPYQFNLANHQTLTSSQSGTPQDPLGALYSFYK